MRDSSPPRAIGWQVALILSSAIVLVQANDRTVRDKAVLEIGCQVLDSGPLPGNVQTCPLPGNVRTCPVAGRVATDRGKGVPVSAGQTLASGRTYRIDLAKAASARVAARVRVELQIVCPTTEKTDRVDRVRAGVASVGPTPAIVQTDLIVRGKVAAENAGQTRGIARICPIVLGKGAAASAGQTLGAGRIGPIDRVKVEVANVGQPPETDPTGRIAPMAESAITRTLETTQTLATEITSSTAAIAR
jgi:hypothetical protein